MDNEPSRTARRIYRHLAERSAEGYCSATQEELIEIAEVSESTLRRAIRNLEKCGWIRTIRRYYRPFRKSKNQYQLLIGVPINLNIGYNKLSTVTGQKMTGWSGVTGQNLQSLSRFDSSTAGHTAGQKVTAMHDDDDEDKEKKESGLWITLNFLHEGERKKRINEPWCVPDFANAWRDWWDRRDFGKLENPAGWANLEMSRGHWPPIQMNLPETRIELRPTKKKVKAWYEGDENLIIGLAQED